MSVIMNLFVPKTFKQIHQFQQNYFFQPSKTLFSDSWSKVAYPFQGELQTQKNLDQYFVKVRFVSEHLLPYVTVAVSYNPGGPYFPLTFLVDTGSHTNYIKRSVIETMLPSKENVFTGSKVLYIGGKQFEFFKPISQQIHDNTHQLNVLGTSCLYECPFIADALLTAIKLPSDEKRTLMEEGRESPPDHDDLL